MPRDLQLGEAVPKKRMTKADRDELRRLIKARMKVLRSDIALRQAELEAELRASVRAAFAAKDKEWDEVRYQVKLATDEANRAINTIYRDHFGVDTWGAHYDKNLVAVQGVRPPGDERGQMLRDGQNDIDGKVAKALAEVDRRELELLEALAVGGLESDAAHEFLARIPTVAELVPAKRMAAIMKTEAQ